MNRTVWRADLPLAMAMVLNAPTGRRIIHVRESDRLTGAAVWFECEPDRPSFPTTLVLVGTGHALPGNADRYLGSIHVDAFVFHLYETGA